MNTTLLTADKDPMGAAIYDSRPNSYGFSPHNSMRMKFR